MSKQIKIIAALLMILSMLTFAGCSKTNDTAEEPAESETAQAEEQETASDETASNDAQNGSDVLVVYFSATGTTKDVAEKIASITNGDLYEIKPAKPYSDADLNWNDKNSRSTKEQNNKKSRPEIASGTVDLSGYKTVYIGYPIWWGEEPGILDTFVESYKFDGIKMIPYILKLKEAASFGDSLLYFGRITRLH